MEDELDLLENKLRDFIQQTEKGKWRCENNHNIQNFTSDEMTSITSSYKNKLGHGAFGEVYKGVLGDGRSVAVKRYINNISKQAFAKEVIVHSQINHKNVVRLIGCCIEENAQMIVLEHVTNGNLKDHLHRGDDIISLHRRLNIATECAEALVSMHSMYKPVLHGDIKPSNILVDNDFHAKLSDFGISRLLSGNNNEWTVNIIGSIGYMDPAFCKDGRLTPKSDVYSFGVVLVELVTKTMPTDTEKKIVERFTQAEGKAVRKLFDPDVRNVGSMKVLEGVAKIARECLKEKIDERPEMNYVAGCLRELRTTLEKEKEKTDQRFFSETHSPLIEREQHETKNVEYSSVLYKIKSHGIFNKSAPKFSKINSKILQNINNIMIFTKNELTNISKNFSTLLYEEYYGNVYLGALANNISVAVKRPKHVKKDLKELAVNELIIQSKLYHKNILKLLGCCLETDVPILVYEYTLNGYLSSYLFLNKEKSGDSSADQQDSWRLLDLSTRYKIALGVARAMEYLHEERMEWVLHCGINPGSILLDDHFCPKVSNFELSKMASKEGKMTFDGGIHGTSGYVAPEWFINPHSEHISAKADVYSFGMVLLEIISGHRNYKCPQESMGSKDWSVPKWVNEEAYLDRWMGDILDQHIIQAEYYNDVNSIATVERMVNTAIWCIQDCAEMRPSMDKVIKMLEGTIQFIQPDNPTFSCFHDDEFTDTDSDSD